MVIAAKCCLSEGKRVQKTDALPPKPQLHGSKSADSVGTSDLVGLRLGRFVLENKSYIRSLTATWGRMFDSRCAGPYL
jgi:hypothetical protein